MTVKTDEAARSREEMTPWLASFTSIGHRLATAATEGHL